MDPQQEGHILHRLDQIDTSIKELRGAFPGGDMEGHKRAHDAMIEDIESRKKLTQAIREKTISGLIWGALGWGS